MDGRGRTLDDHAFGDRVIFVADIVSLQKLGVTGLPFLEMCRRNITENDGAFKVPYPVPKEMGSDLLESNRGGFWVGNR